MCNKSIRWAFNFASWKPTQAEMLLATSCIQPEEKQRIAKFVFKKDFKASLIGRLMIRKFINSVTNIPYNLIKIYRDEKGKPIFDNKNCSVKFNFNVSHQGDFTVLSGEINSAQVGVDVMKIDYSGGKTLEEFFRIMNRQFSQNEWIQIRDGFDERSKLTTFCRNWCLKESYVKATGVGITVNLQELSFKMNTPCIFKSDIVMDTELFVKGRKEHWLFEEMLLDDNHIVTTALRTEDTLQNYEPVHFSILTFDELIKNAIPLLESDVEYCNNYFSKDE